jgi:hypothetical protein
MEELMRGDRWTQQELEGLIIIMKTAWWVAFVVVCLVIFAQAAVGLFELAEMTRW